MQEILWGLQTKKHIFFHTYLWIMNSLYRKQNSTHIQADIIDNAPDYENNVMFLHILQILNVVMCFPGHEKTQMETWKSLLCMNSIVLILSNMTKTISDEST